ncbi:hypothetical protein BOTBODRAFT_34432 [Botryobasidium botryosum FD-172 SS1]|uniref:Uncharacterized protein n=1 Tax=Botryobasidium botryosum (strain FD-172 SS1) TaxID=930990 RepID=A0A067MA83_BOTB1|nr:hypothetical protein BOTBODRAFT_34432 [Botryobasidium botryosum FD-172 SS1]
MRAFTDELWGQPAKIVIGFDIGTTQAAVSFAHLYPGGPQGVQRVVQWPGQENQGGESKIPSLIWYDQLGRARAFGAEARKSDVLDQAEDGGWKLAKHFKLHLHPDSMKSSHQITLDPLPPQVPVEKIYADFIGYLFRQTKRFFQERILDGENTWKLLERKIDFIIAHPNGWDITEQTILRQAVIDAGILPSLSAALERVYFVSEAEASVHFVLHHTDLEARLEIQDNFIVCDAGGSTVDTTLYTASQIKPLLRLEEKRASACVQAGAIFVNQSAKEYLFELFSKSDLDEETAAEYISEALESFETDAKKSFRDASEEKTLSVGGRKFTSAELNVRRGSMALRGSVVEGFFDPWVTKIIESVNSQIEGHSVKYILLVGGFGESHYLRQRLREGPASAGIELTLADDPTSKAVADGAVIWFMKHSVTARATRFAFGTQVIVPAHSIDGPKIGRRVFQNPDGPYITGGWWQVVPKGQVLENDTEISRELHHSYGSKKPKLQNYSCPIYSYDGVDEPLFMTDTKDLIKPGFNHICDVAANLSGLKGALVRRTGPNGAYWTIGFSIALTFGGTELKASLVWEEHGIMRRGPASIIPPSKI